MKNAAILASALALLAGCGKKPPTPQDELDRRFMSMMQSVTLVGHSTRLNSDKMFGEEHYVIDSVSKIGAETWLLHARYQENGHDLPLPVPVTIKWAGDTPVIELTDLSIPGAGTYTARVVLYNDQYAGTWSSKHGGGQVFGRIVHR